jgi:hypothetical protein
MNSSSLNEHLFIRNLVDFPNCACGQVESTSHFFISCKKYTDLRNELMYTINGPVTIDVKLVLNGSDTLSADQNIDIFIKVQNFILKSKIYIIILSCISSVLLILYLSVLLFQSVLLFFFLDLSCSMFYNLCAIRY